MELDEMILVSVDDHTIEPPDLFRGRVPKKYDDEAPKVVRTEDGVDMWVYAGIPRPQIGINAVAGRPREEYGFEPSAYADMRPGTYDVHERVKDMSAAGVLGSMCFPSFPRFCGQFFAEAPDVGLARAVVEAYNDWHIEEWAGAYPDRFIPLSIPKLWSAEECAAEVRRVAAKGCHAVSFSENPAALGLASLHHNSWDPFWQACEDEGTVVCMHIGSSSQTPVTASDAPIDVTFVLSPVSIVSAAADVLFSPIFRKFPNIKFALSEGGIGWVPYFLERVDYVYDHHHAWTGADFGGRLPSEVFLERFITCFVDDAFGVESRSHLNLDLVTWECDYPHSDSNWPDAPEILADRLAGVPDDEIDKITHLNAMREFRFDPFSVRPRDRSTVGALRAEVAGHDVTIRAKGTKAGKPVGATAGQLTATFRPEVPVRVGED